MGGRKILCRMLLTALMTGAVTSHAGAPEYIWSDDKGALSAAQCTPSKAKVADVPFKVLYKTKGEAGDEIAVAGNHRLLLKNLSLVTSVRTRSSLPAFTELIKVVSAPQRISYSDDQTYAVRGTQGVVRTASLRPIGEFRLLLTGGSAKVTGGAVTKIGEAGVALARSQWVLASQDGAPVFYSCPDHPNAKYFIFEMIPYAMSQPVLRLGVKFSETQIFSTAAIDTAAILESAPPINMWTGFLGVIGMGDSNKDPNQGSSVDENEDDEVNNENAGGNDGEDGGGRDNEAPVAQEPSGTGAPKAIEGSNRLIVCDGEGINVRDEAIGEKPLFQSRPFERIFLKTDFGKPNTKKGVVLGKTFTFKKVQFIDRTPPKPGTDVTGWITEGFISTEAGCKAFQESLHNVVCIKSGKQWVRDDQNEEMFPLNPLEDIIRKPDWKQRADQRTIDGKAYDFIPVIVPGENMAEGWIALDSLLPESECVKKREEMLNSSKGLDDPDCCSYPLAKRAWYPYTKKDDPGKKWFGAKRSGRHHAACDLFNDIGASVRAVTAGVVDSDPAVFTRRKKKGGPISYDFSIKHTGGKIIRYGELSGIPSKFRKGRQVVAEEKLGVVSYTNMAHIEMYSGTGRGPLTVYPRRNKRGKVVESNAIVKEFLRRSDLIDPTSYLLRWENNAFGPRKK